MANTIQLAQNYLGAFEEKLTLGELTKDLNKIKYSWAGGNAVKVAKPDIVNITSYNRQAGYNASDFNITWQTMTLNQDRVIAISIDEMDNEETKETAVAGALADSAIEATEEMDMYRLGVIANTGVASGVNATATLSNGQAVYDAIAVGEASQINNKAKLTECILYINATSYMLLKGAMPYRFIETKTPDAIFESYDGMKVVIVPDTMLSVGTEYNGTTGKIEAKVYNSTKHQYVNFLIVDKRVVVAPVKLYDKKFIDASVNQTARANKVILNWYHDCFVLDRGAKAIYVHKKAEA